MKKKRYLWLIAGIILLLVLTVMIKKGVERKQKEECAITAMYVPFGKGSHVFIEIEDRHNVFSVYVRDGDCKIYDINGKKIEFHQLVKGNVVKIYGDGMMGAAAILTRGSYTWNYVDADGINKTAKAEGLHVLKWGDELRNIRLTVPTDLTPDIYDKPQQVEVIRYSRSLLGTEDIPKGEKVTVVQKDENFVIENASGDYVYSVTGIWENGRVEFGFMTSSK